MTHGHPTQSSHQHGPHSGADPHADCGRDHRGGVHVHNHVPKDFGFAFALGTALNVGFVVLEAAAGVFANSMALLADAGHNLSDVLCFTAWLFASGGERDVNIRGAYLHMAADAAISFGVVVAGIAMLLTGWNWLDPVVSLVLVAAIVWATWGLLRDATRLALHGVPAGIDPARVQSRLAALPGVASLHDLHIWPMSTTETALTCHLVMPGGHPGDAFILQATKILNDEFEIRHATLQFEVGNDIPCGLEESCMTSTEAIK
jgi:cobalt-zinc-cadmium efflux system protein